jgi:ribonuclease BN (tRNA processing enzyme)
VLPPPGEHVLQERALIRLDEEHRPHPAAGGWRRSHTTAGDAGRTATDARAKHLALVHILPEGDPREWVAAAVAEASAYYSGPVIAPDDLAAISV